MAKRHRRRAAAARALGIELKRQPLSELHELLLKDAASLARYDNLLGLDRNGRGDRGRKRRPTRSDDPPITDHSDYTSFHGTKRVGADRFSVEAATIEDEIIKHLHGLKGASVEISIDIQARVPGGVPEDVLKTVTENARNLRFDVNIGFEEE